jgi:hypothetical protein
VRRRKIGVDEPAQRKPWMRYEQVFIWGAVIVTAFVVAVAITYRAMS